MDRRIALNNLICEKFSSIGRWVWDKFDFENDNLEEAIKAEAPRHVYYQPPENLKLHYPCIVYELDDIQKVHADNGSYLMNHIYTLTVIDRDPDSIIREKIAELPKCSFSRSFENENLHHYVFKIYD